MSKQSGATIPTTEPAAQPRLSPVPPARLATILPLEEAVMQAAGMLDLVAAKFESHVRGGEISFEQPEWLTDILILCANAECNLRRAYREHSEEVFRVTHQPTNPQAR